MCKVTPEQAEKSLSDYLDKNGHGSLTAYQYGCRCLLCKESATIHKSNYWKEIKKDPKKHEQWKIDWKHNYHLRKSND